MWDCRDEKLDIAEVSEAVGSFFEVMDIGTVVGQYLTCAGIGCDCAVLNGGTCGDELCKEIVYHCKQSFCDFWEVWSIYLPLQLRCSLCSRIICVECEDVRMCRKCLESVLNDVRYAPTPSSSDDSEDDETPRYPVRLFRLNQFQSFEWEIVPGQFDDASDSFEGEE